MAAPADPVDFALTSQCIPSAGATVSVRFTWSLVSGATSYRFERWNGSAWVFVLNYGATATFADVTALAAGTAVQYRLRASNTSGDSGYISASFTTAVREASIASIDLPTGIGVSVILATSAVLSWSDVEGADSDFEIGLKDLVTGVETVYSATGLLTSFSLPLVSGRTFQVRMRSVAKLSGGSVASTAWTTAQEFTAAGALALISIPSEITLINGRAISMFFDIAGVSGAVVFNWFDRPPGLTLEDEGNTVSVTGIRLTGTPTAGGIYDSVFQIVGGSLALTTIPVRFLVDGEGWIGAFHQDPQRIDLVIDVRSGQVTGHYFSGVGSEPFLSVPLGLAVPASVFFKDGERYISAGITAVSLSAQMEANFDTPPLFVAENTSPVVDTYGRAYGITLPFTPDGATLREISSAIQKGPAGAPDGGAVQLSARITYTRAGYTARTEPFLLKIRPS
jgi:hypothetical protein